MTTPLRRFASESEISQARQFNKKLAWLPRFRIRNRLTPRLIQALLRLGQWVGPARLARHGLKARTEHASVGASRVPVRIIRPATKAMGIVLDFHGGGWVIGNARMNDDLNVAIATECSVIVVSVDYRLAVSTPIEGLLDDCLCAARWLLGEARAEFAGLPVVVVGESAGGHLAMATLLALKAWPELLRRIAGTLLYYGVFDLGGTASVRSAGPDTLVLDGPGMVKAFETLTPGLSAQQRRQPPLSPLFGDLAGMPPALMFVGELDPLRDDSLELAKRWPSSVPIEVHLLPASPHGFIHFPTAIAANVLSYSRAWIHGKVQAAASER